VTDGAEPKVRPQKLAASYFLGIFMVVLAVAMWMRGMGRFLLPLVIAVIVVSVLGRIVKAIRAPLP